jgi:hypothetical protein
VPVRPGGVIDVPRYLRNQLGRRVFDRPLQDGTYRERELRLRRFDTVYVRSGFRFATIHFRGELGWDDSPPVDAVRAILESTPEGDRLWELPGIDLVVYADTDHEILLRSPRGTARVAERLGDAGPEYRYIPVPDDVLGYTSDPALAAFVTRGFHRSRDWLRATRGQVYPDVVPHLIPLLQARRTGDVLLFAAHGHTFGPEKGGHGGIHADDMRIPMMFAGPGIPAGGRIDVARAVDLAPTLLALLGCELPDDGLMEGVSLLPELLAPAAAPTEQR